MIGFFLILALTGSLAGIIAGLFGVGGGIILVPAFLFVFQALGYEHVQLAQIAVATSLATIVFTAARSVRAHHQKGAVDFDILRSWAPAICIGAIAGVLTATRISATALLFVFAILAIIVSIVMGFGLGRGQVFKTLPNGAKKWSLAGAIGFFSTLMGIGGGSFAVPALALYGVAVHRAVATAAGIGGLIAIPAVAGFLVADVDTRNLPPMTVGYVNFPAFFIVIIATALTAPLGVKLAHHLDGVRLRKLFAIFIFVVALNMLRKALF